MNKEKLSKKNNLIIVGSARGIKRFYVVNQFIEEFPESKVINTGNLLQQLIIKMGFKSLDSISIFNYYKYIEPMFIEIILSHLEHSTVILDTHYYYLLPGLSIKEIVKFKQQINNCVLVLVEDCEEKIIEDNDDKWFESIKNVEEDLLLNKHSFNSYKEIFSSFSNVFSCYVNLENDETNKIKNLIGELKNGIKRSPRKSKRIF